VSTTLMPPSFYAVRRQGCPPYIFETVREAARALLDLAPAAATVDVVVGSHRRSLSDRELLEVRRHIRARRAALAAAIAVSVAPPMSPAAPSRKAHRVSHSTARATRAMRMKVPPLLDIGALQEGLAAGLHKERHEHGSRSADV
jgi:hypothetical protein